MHDFKEILHFFGEKLNAQPVQEDIEAKHVHLVVNDYLIDITEGVLPGSLNLELALGTFSKEPQDIFLQQLLEANFLGAYTAGCTFAIYGHSLILRANTVPPTSPQENWEWLNRILTVAEGWKEQLKQIGGLTLTVA